MVTTNVNALQGFSVDALFAHSPEPFRITKETSDEVLMVRIGYGDGEAMSFLYGRYAGIVFSIGRRLLRDVSEAEDLVQDVFLELFRNARRFDPEKGRARGWILGLTYMRGLNHRKKLIHRQFYNHEDCACLDFENSEPRRSSSRPSEITESDWIMIMNKGMKRLSENERITLIRVIYEGWTLPEVAEYLGKSLGNVTHYYYRGLVKVRTAIEN